ncbi:MAG: mechanosensitive ion channel family protein [Sedimentisphaerales bacterium]|nr:mechanosensitive ion channel family protein [Sedimentisphaerales bacterium]
MQEQLGTILPHIQNIALALGVSFVAYLLTLPLRRRYASCETIEPTLTRRSGRQFLCMLLSHVAFPVVVLVLSLPVSYWLYHPQERSFHHTWLLFWSIYAIIRLTEGLLVELFVQMGRPCPLSRLMRGLLRLAVMLAVAFMLIRFQLNYQIGVLLTSTAIVTGVIGFAMQGVLGNLLAGMSLHACRSMQVGDWVDIDGLRGQVTLVNWRETRIRKGGHTIIIPNSRVAGATVYNYCVPTTLRRHDVPVAASYGDAPGDVIAALLEAAANVPEVLKQPEPDAYITGFKDFCIEYVLRFWSHHYHFRTAIEGDVMRMIWYKFNRRGIEIPFPMSGRLLSNFMEAVHAQQFEKPLASEIERNVDDLVHSDFGRKLMADAQGVCLLSRDELRAIARDVKRTRFTTGEVLMRQDDDGESFYVLVRGIVKGSIMNSDTAHPIQFELQPGALFGEMSLLTGLPRSATMTATTNCELLEFDRGAFARLLSLREEIPRMLSDLAATRAAENARSLERLRASAVVPPELARDGILHRLRRILGDWRGR